jgi:hypothetical protein
MSRNIVNCQLSIKKMLYGWMRAARWWWAGGKIYLVPKRIVP